MKKHIYSFLFGKAGNSIQQKVPIVKIRSQFLQDNDEEFFEVRNKMKPFVKTIASDSVSDYHAYYKFRLNTAERRKKNIEKTKAKQALDIQNLNNKGQFSSETEDQPLVGENTTKDTDIHD